MPDHTATEQRNIATVTAMFEAGRELDRATLFADDAVWWNGLPLLPGNVGQTVAEGAEAAVRVATLGAAAPTGTVTDRAGVLPW